MKKIPTTNEAKSNYDAIVKAGGMADALPPLEQLVLRFRPASIMGYWSFRRQLRRILTEGTDTPEGERRADEFVKKYAPSGSWVQFTNLLLKAIKEAGEEE